MESGTMVYNGNYQIAVIRRSFMTGVFGWMTLALVITGLLAGWISTTPALRDVIFRHRLLFIMLFVAELFMVIGLTAFIRRISVNVAIWVFIGFAVLNGITLSALFYIFTMESIARAFYISAGTFGIMSVYGYFTRKDLSHIGNVAGLALIGILVATLVNLFLPSTTLYWIISYAGVILFTALTAYDVQKIKVLSDRASIDRQSWQKGAVIGALLLYLDFVNLFLFFLRIFGGRQ